MPLTQKLPYIDLRGRMMLFVALLASACSSLGPDNVAPDQFDYNQAIGQASNEQMLLNLIRLRYSDVPVFLAVNSVLTQYVYTGGVNLAGAVGTLQGEDANSVGGTAGVRYIERPTITYSPMSGEGFAKQMMTPIPVDLMFSLLQSGWPAIDLMAMGIVRLGEARNPSFPAALTETGQEQRREFRAASALLLEVATRDGLEMLEDVEGEQPPERYLVFRRSEDPEIAELIERLKLKLGLSPEIWKFRVTRNMIERGEEDITIRARSLLDLMGYLSRGVQVPTDHFDKHISHPSEPELAAAKLVPLRIRSGPESPDNAFVRVNYLDQWFWIDPVDEQGKASFGILTYMFLMMAPKPDGAGPLVTIPTG